jgi:hypothetical protein
LRTRSWDSKKSFKQRTYGLMGVSPLSSKMGTVFGGGRFPLTFAAISVLHHLCYTGFTL